jgi:beta-N-acetylhexosaminidase
MASGELPWSLAEPLAQQLSGTEAMDVRDATAADQLARAAAERGLVLVVRDPQRHAWQLDLVRFATVIVDVGWPAELPTTAPVLRTRGVAPGLLDAAAGVLAKG